MRVEDLERELRAERPEPDQEFTRKLDDWAAAGFPRGELDPRARAARAGRRRVSGAPSASSGSGSPRPRRGGSSPRWPPPRRSS